MPSDLFARAKGPRLHCGEWDVFATLDGLICPWCKADCADAPHKWVSTEGDKSEHAITACPDCGKEFLCPDEHGDLVCVGLLSPADMAYQAQRAGRALADAGEGNARAISNQDRIA